MPLVIENATIDSLAGRAEVVAALPQVFKSFAGLKQKLSSGCNCDRTRKQVAQLYEQVKLAIVSLGEADRATLRGLLNADKLIVYVLRDGRNGVKYEL
jgi:hypothetical protein